MRLAEIYTKKSLYKLAYQTLVEAEEIVPVGAISPNEVVVPGVFVDNIVQGVK